MLRFRVLQCDGAARLLSANTPYHAALSGAQTTLGAQLSGALQPPTAADLGRPAVELDLLLRPGVNSGRRGSGDQKRRKSAVLLLATGTSPRPACGTGSRVTSH